MNKNRVRLTESQLHRVIKESVKKILREGSKYLKNTYEVSISYFLSNENYKNESYAKELVDTWYSMNNCLTADWYDDGEDYCVDIIFNIDSQSDGNFEELDNEINKYLSKNGLDNFTWNYHYIKGIHNGFYWQP